jgi:hypothetical protein
MLRYWSSERTLWLHDVFGAPTPLNPPDLSGRISGTLGIDPRSDPQGRLRADLAELEIRLNRVTKQPPLTLWTTRAWLPTVANQPTA